MNIFILSLNMSECVHWYPDKHIVKMPIEATQMLCNVFHYTGEFDLMNEESQDKIYLPTHMNHPCSIWTRESLSNWLWLRKLVCYMGNEYRFRYGRVHKSVITAMGLPIPKIPDKGLTDFAKAVPDEFKHLDVCNAYIEYFKEYKRHLIKYTKRPIPDWWRDEEMK